MSVRAACPARPIGGVGQLQSAWFSTSLARARGLIGSRPGRIAVGVVSSFLAAALLAVAIHHFVTAGWPLAGGNPFVLAAVGLLFLLAYGLKAYGWRRLFRASERPDTLSLAAAGGGASIMGVALPGRFDEAARVAIVRRSPGCPATVPTICLSLFTLGLIDNIALSPLAVVSASFPGLSFLFSRCRGSPGRRDCSASGSFAGSVPGPPALGTRPTPGGS
jgi:hypothetical protein